MRRVGVALDRAHRAADDVASWFEQSETVTATMTLIHDGAVAMIDALPVMGGDGTPKVVNIEPAWMFDVSQTDERTQRPAT